MMVCTRIIKLRKINHKVLFRYFHETPRLLGVLKNSPNAQLDKSIYNRYMCLPIPELKVHGTYIWIDGTGENLRSKSRTLEFNPSTYKEIPNGTFDGSNTLQAPVQNPDCYLIPIAMYHDPIRRGTSKLVLCETFDANEKPSKSNHRQACVASLNRICDQQVEIGFKQEYFFTGKSGKPFGWSTEGDPEPSDFQYAGVGAFKVYGREIAESFYRCCLYCGIDIAGDKPERFLSQWEFRTGPSSCIKAADDLWMARWLLTRIAEDFGVGVSFQPSFSPKWHGSGLHVTFSSKRMREENGLRHIEEAIKKLEKRHDDHMAVYDPKGGADNIKRLTGQFNSSLANKFTFKVADRTASVRITKTVNAKKKGFFEDRRPAANADPYQVINALVKTCIIE
ncbi:glutamine synthetase [Leptinotarsa decemlineata]|uniref:glutamine synthetase n=1 Tax=Leptinotarsa decemlineata TaxID=7539 RepID=UPI000C2539A3|nr:glutamine synthetase-like [Leptinotarsa decemlineata]